MLQCIYGGSYRLYIVTDDTRVGINDIFVNCIIKILMYMYVFCDHEDDNADNMMMCHAAAAAAVTVGGNTEDQFGNTIPMRS